MKAITLYQPYASLAAIHAKPHETRSWGTKYRGPIAIHAGKNYSAWYGDCDKEYLRAVYNALKPLFFPNIMCNQGDLCDAAPRGVVIATAVLTECWRVIEHTPTAIILKQSNGVGEDKISIDAPYLAFGDYSVGRYIWGFADVRVLPEPIPVRGYQGLWNWTPPEGVAV